MKKLVQVWTALLLTLTLVCPARAAGGLTLQMQGTDNVRLTLQNLGSREVNSVQLELTLNGSYPRAAFASDASSEQYSFCRVEEENGRTQITLYVDSLRSLNQNGTATLGTLALGDDCTAPDTARLTILDRGLESGGAEQVIPVRSDFENSGGSSGGSGGESGGRNYSIYTSSTGHGTISVRPTSARWGENVTVTVRPDSGFRLTELIAQSSGRRLQLNDRGGGTFVFAMPGDEVEVRGVFEASLPFRDVKEGVWFHDAVAYVYEKGLMSGTASGAFSPDQSTSRGMIVTILHRLSGSPDVGSSDFKDVADGQYYARAVAWAAANGVVSGYGDGRFGPNDPITREQLAVILRGYARLNGKDVSASADLSGYSDARQISAYAREAMSWACAEGLINGTSANTLTPAGTATRAQAAVILRGFCEHVIS